MEFKKPHLAQNYRQAGWARPSWRYPSPRRAGHLLRCPNGDGERSAALLPRLRYGSNAKPSARNPPTALLSVPAPC